MIYHLLYPLKDYFFVFNLTRYITFRGACAFIFAFFLVAFFWKLTIKHLTRLNYQEKVDMYGHIHLEVLHKSKKGTPTMGGILIVAAVVISALLWARWDANLIWYLLFVFVALAILGVRDDWLKVKTAKGLTRKHKLVYQAAIALVFGCMLLVDNQFPLTIGFPFLKDLVIKLGVFYLLWVILVIVSTSNAVNFTDGLDGLAIGSIVISCLVFVLFSYLSGNVKFSSYLLIPYIRHAGELAVICAAVAGAGLAFLWFNSHPAEIFMGDVGALSLGGFLGAVALLVKKEFVLVICGGLFVAEAFSVVIQIISVRLRGKKVFKAAPLHHHLELKGWPESKIVVRLWIVAIILAMVSLLTLKLR